MPESAPLIRRLTADTDALTKGADGVFPLGPCPFAGKVTAVSFIPATVLTGANTNSITFKLINKGAAGSGTAVVAELAFVSGVNAAANDEKALTLSGTAAKLEVAEGDVLTLEEVHVGEGLITPSGEIQVKIERS
jgi:hypothetical protein